MSLEFCQTAAVGSSVPVLLVNTHQTVCSHPALSCCFLDVSWVDCSGNFHVWVVVAKPKWNIGLEFY